MRVLLQLQLPGGSFTKSSITLTRGGDTVVIPISLEMSKEIQTLFPEVPTEW